MPNDIYQQLIDLGCSEQDIENSLLSGISLKEQLETQLAELDETHVDPTADLLDQHFPNSFIY